MTPPVFWAQDQGHNILSMSKFIIIGGKPLEGEISVAGSKNAVLPLMAACLLTEEECLLSNVPEIEDVKTMAEAMRRLGAFVEFAGDKLKIRASNPIVSEPDEELVVKFRGSVLFLGSLLARTGRVKLPKSGGDKIGVRTIEPHLSGLRQLGAVVDDSEGYNLKVLSRLQGVTIVMEETSVTATENLLLAAATARGITTIKLAAMEPHVQQLAEFLNKMGAKISGIGSPTLVIQGQNQLHGAQEEIIPDSSQAATFITLAAATRGHVRVRNLNPAFLDDFLLKIKQFGVKFQVKDDCVEVMPPDKDYQGIKKLQVGLYPKLASDDTPPLAVLATQAIGETVIYEWLYEDRLGYAPELNKMGAHAEILDPHRVKIIGPTKLRGQKLICNDIRMGMALVIAALTAEGQSEIINIEHVDRGYERLEERLQALGAEIQRMN